MAVVQAIKLLGVREEMSESARAVYDKTIDILPDFSIDTELSDHIDAFVAFVKNEKLSFIK
jgi:hypothetical protein